MDVEYSSSGNESTFEAGQCALVALVHKEFGFSLQLFAENVDEG